MANRNLTAEELAQANDLLEKIRLDLKTLASGDEPLHFAYRRKITKELGYDERGKPTLRRILKLKKFVEQKGICPLCDGSLPEKNAVLDRLKAIDGYTRENTRLICRDCDTRVQEGRGYA
jgi:hypothetical protein